VTEPKYKTRRRHENPAHARLINFTCFHNRPFLKSERACTWVIDAIARAREIHDFRLWAYCIMPEHVHLLIWPRSELPPILASIKQSVANRAIVWVKVNAPTFLPALSVTRPDGCLSHRFWQRGGGYDRNLWSARHIWEAIDYIHMNPVEAGLCALPEQWAWSSARFFTRHRAGLLAIDLDTIPSRPA
jgi:putative transposase